MSPRRGGQDFKLVETLPRRTLLSRMPHQYPQFQDLSCTHPNGQILSALINGDLGWLLYMRCEGASSFHSVNPEYRGSPDAAIKYRLNNGQVDEYPASWALPADLVRRALDWLNEEGTRPPFVVWVEDG
jgi:hypothetical protein